MFVLGMASVLSLASVLAGHTDKKTNQHGVLELTSGLQAAPAPHQTAPLPAGQAIIEALILVEASQVCQFRTCWVQMQSHP